MTDLRSLPSVDKLLNTQTAAELIAEYGRPLVLDAFRTVLDEAREAFLAPKSKTIPPAETLLDLAGSHLDAWTQPTLYPVINATGVILHTNLGRAPLSKATTKAMEMVGRNYSTLEFDMRNGKRGSRLVHAENVLKMITGA